MREKQPSAISSQQSATAEIPAWMADLDRQVEMELEWIRGKRAIVFTVFTLGMGFVLGCLGSWIFRAVWL